MTHHISTKSPAQVTPLFLQTVQEAANSPAFQAYRSALAFIPPSMTVATEERNTVLQILVTERIAQEGLEWQDNTVRILVTERIAQEGLDLLSTELPEAIIDERYDLSPAVLREVICSYTALIVSSQTLVTAELLEAAARLQVIGRVGKRVDNIAVEAAFQRGICVVNAPNGNVVAAAEHTIAMLLALVRHLPAATSSMRSGTWEKQCFLGIEVSNKVLGVLGLGKIGTAVALRAQGLGMHVLASDPFVSSVQAEALDVTLATLEEVLYHADVVTLHAGLSTNTTGSGNGNHHLLGSRELALLKPGAYLVNCAQGDLIDEDALLAALNEHRLAGVALDIFSQESAGQHAVLQQLIAHPRVIATPHLRAATREAQVREALEVARSIIAVLCDEPAPHEVKAYSWRATNT